MWPYKSDSENALFLTNLLLYSEAWIGQTKYIGMTTKEGSTQIINFMTPGAGVFAKWVWLYKSYSKNTLFL